MKTAIRSSTFWWPLVFLFVVLAPTRALAAGAPSGGASVTVADGVLRPSGVAILAGGSVLWTNRGTRQHEIVAQRSAFPSFRLAPGAARSVAFMKPGQYPYLLDGAVKGMVVVVGPGGVGAGGTGGGGQPSASPTGCLTIYRYDVRIAVHREATYAGSAEQKTVSDWKASWVAPVYVDRCPGLGFPMLITASPAAMSGNRGWPVLLHGGQFEGTYDLNEPGCHYTITINAPGVMAVAAIYTNTSQRFDFLGGQDFDDEAISKANWDRENDARVAACGPHQPVRSANYTSIGDTSMPLNGFDGMMIGDDQLHLTFAMPPNSPVDTPILDALAAGKGFNYDTGMQLYQDKIGTSSRMRATVSFSRLEN